MLTKIDNEIEIPPIKELPVCYYCQHILQINNIYIDNSNCVYLDYKCVCRQSNHLIPFDKYYYQLQLYNNFKRHACKCKKEKSICYCFKCNFYIGEDCLKLHLKHILFHNEIKKYYPKCHKTRKTLFCYQGNTTICEICLKNKNNNQKINTLFEYYLSVKKSIPKNQEEYISKIKGTYPNLPSSTINSLKNLFSFFIDCFNYTSNIPNYNIITSLSNITVIKFSKKERLVKYKKHLKVPFIRYEADYSKIDFDKKKERTELDDTYSIDQIIILENNNILEISNRYGDNSAYPNIIAIYSNTFSELKCQYMLSFYPIKFIPLLKYLYMLVGYGIIQILTIKDDRIKKIKQIDFEGQKKIESVKLNNNYVGCFCDYTFFLIDLKLYTIKKIHNYPRDDNSYHDVREESSQMLSLPDNRVVITFNVSLDIWNYHTKTLLYRSKHMEYDIIPDGFYFRQSVVVDDNTIFSAFFYSVALWNYNSLTNVYYKTFDDNYFLSVNQLKVYKEECIMAITESDELILFQRDTGMILQFIQLRQRRMPGLYSFFVELPYDTLLVCTLKTIIYLLDYQ